MKLEIITLLLAQDGINAFLCPQQPVAFPITRRVLGVDSTKATTVSRRMSQTDEKTNSGIFSDEVQQEAQEVLEKVGWAKPMNDGEMTSEDPFVQQIDAGIQRDFGVGLDDLLNPAKVTKKDILSINELSSPWLYMC